MRFPRRLKWLPITAITALTLVSCSDTTLATRSFTEDFPVFTIPGTSLIQLAVNDLSYPVPVNLATQEAYANGDFDYVSSVTVRSVTLEIDPTSDTEANDDGNPDDFDFLSKLEVYLRATIDGTVREDLVASLPEGDEQYSSGARSIVLNTTSVDVLDYIELGDGYDMVIKVSGLSPIDPVIIGGSLKYRVGIGFR